MTRRVVINADDFGLAPGVNRGIVEAFRDGVLTSTTTLVNMPHFEQAAELASANPDLPVGVHLTLLWGDPVSSAREVPSLVDGNGRFPTSLGRLARRYFLGQLSVDDARREFCAQLDRFHQTGLRPTHVDTHKHVHCLPGVMQAATSAAAEFGIERIRFPMERHLPGMDEVRSSSSRAKAMLIRLLCRRSRPVLDRAGLRTTDSFCGIGFQHALDGALLVRVLGALPPGATEIMCHPGYDDDVLRSWTRVPLRREIELEGLKDPRVKDYVAAEGIELIDFSKL